MFRRYFVRRASSHKFLLDSLHCAYTFTCEFRNITDGIALVQAGQVTGQCPAIIQRNWQPHRAVQGTGLCSAEKPRLARSLRKMGRTLTCPLSRLSPVPLKNGPSECETKPTKIAISGLFLVGSTPVHPST